MKRIGFQLKVRQEQIEAYTEHHRNVWPEMKRALTRHGWSNYSLYMSSDGTLFGYFEATTSFEESLRGMSTENINKEWQALMSPLFEIPQGDAADEMMVELQEVFHLD